jgi:hypothetical protein
MKGDIPKLLAAAQEYWLHVRLDVVVEILDAALRNMHQDVRTMELELLRHRAFRDEPDYSTPGTERDRRAVLDRTVEWLRQAEHRVRAASALRSLLEGLDTPYSQVRDVSVLQQLFESPRETAPKEGPPTLPRYVYELSVLGKKLNEKQREYLACYASGMTEMECNVRPSVKVETTDEEVPEGWETDDDESDGNESV